jgi:hypothetical protein
LETATANCKPFKDEVDRLQKLLQEQDAECRGITDPTEARICRQIRAGIASQLSRAKDALRNCQSGLPAPGVQRARGRIAFLRVHDSGGYGPPSDHLNSEVIFKLDTQPNRAFGFALQDDASRPAHEGMLMLLRDALANNFDVATDYEQVENKANSVAFRIELTPGERGQVVRPIVLRE